MLVCAVPFLQPLHGYPHHYYNMTHQGLRALFEDRLTIEAVRVTGQGLPVHALAWIVRSWAAGLNDSTREQFLSLRLSDLLAPASELANAPWVRELSEQKNLELASATRLVARKA
jgi:hypothetical protein